MPPAIVAPVDKPYAGPIQLSVDITDITDRVWKVHEDVPVETRPRGRARKKWSCSIPSGSRGIMSRQAPSQLSLESSQRRRQARAVGARPREHVRLPRAAERGREDRRPGLRLSLAHQAQRRPHRGLRRNCRPGMERSSDVSGGIFLARHFLRPHAEASLRLEICDRARNGVQPGRYRPLRTHHPQHAGGFAALRRPLLQPRSTCRPHPPIPCT